MSKLIRFVPLSMKVLVAAKEGEIKDWAAYIDAVPGEKHGEEYKEVLKYGTKLPYEIAKVIFPDFDEMFVWRK